MTLGWWTKSTTFCRNRIWHFQVLLGLPFYLQASKCLIVLVIGSRLCCCTFVVIDSLAWTSKSRCGPDASVRRIMDQILVILSAHLSDGACFIIFVDCYLFWPFKTYVMACLMVVLEPFLMVVLELWSWRFIFNPIFILLCTLRYIHLLLAEPISFVDRPTYFYSKCDES